MYPRKTDPLDPFPFLELWLQGPFIPWPAENSCRARSSQHAAPIIPSHFEKQDGMCRRKATNNIKTGYKKPIARRVCKVFANIWLCSVRFVFVQSTILETFGTVNDDDFCLRLEVITERGSDQRSYRSNSEPGCFASLKECEVPINIIWQMKIMYGDDCTSQRTVYNW